MNSPMGLRGVICERFGWTLDYLENEIPWIDVHTMMIDAPQFVMPDDKGTGDPKKAVEPKTNDQKLKKLDNLFNKYQE